MSFPGIKTKNIKELDNDTGVTIEDVLVKDDEIKFNSNSLEVKTAFGALKDPTGFPDPTTQTSTFTNGTLLFEISPVGDDFEVFIQGVRYVKDATEDITIADTEGIHIIYYDTSGALQELVNPTETAIQSMIINQTMVAIIYWDAVTGGGQQIYFTGDNEYHGTVMSGATHAYLHYVVGAKYISGMTPSDVVSDGDGDVNASAQFGLVSGTFNDEDLTISLSTIASTVGLPIYYLDGASANWRRSIVAGYSVRNKTSLIAYNEDSGGTWQQTELGNNNFVLCHVFATNDSTYDYISIQGQNEYTNIGNARDGAETELISLYTVGLPFVEFIPIATFIFQTSSGDSNGVKGRIRSTDTGDDYIDWRSVTFAATGVTSTDHGALSGLTDDDHTQYALLAGRSGGQQVIGGTGSGDDLTFDTTTDGTKGSYIFTDLDASRLLSTDGSKALESVSDLSSWINGTTDEITVTSHGATGTITLSLPATVDIGSGTLKVDHIIESNTDHGIDLEDVVHIENGTLAIGSGSEAITTKLSIHGVDGGSMETGPNITFYTSADIHPLYSTYNYKHDNISWCFDAYGSGIGWTSSSVNSNFRWVKSATAFGIFGETGNAPGTSIGWTKNIINFNAATSNVEIPTGGILLSQSIASRLCYTDGSKLVQSVANLTSWVDGGTGLTAVNDADGTMTLNLDNTIAPTTSVTTSTIYVDDISEKTGDHGVTIENCHHEDGKLHLGATSFTEPTRGKLKISGTPSGGSGGPHMEFINDGGTYPYMQIHNQSSIIQSINLGCYYNTSGVIKSSAVEGNFELLNQGGIFYIKSDVGVDPGNTASLNTAIKIYASSGNVSMPYVYIHDMNGETIRDVQINNGGELGYDSGSLEMMKTNIIYNPDVDFIHKIDICSYNYRKRIKKGWTPDCFSENDYHPRMEYGCMIEQLDLLNKNMCFYDEVEGGLMEPRGIRWKKMIPAIIKCVQTQKIEIDTLKSLIEKLNTRLSLIEDIMLNTT